MSIFSKKLVKQAAQRNRSKIALPSRVITTNDFGFCLPIFAREVIAGDKWKINLKSFTRLAPMPVPTYGDFRQVNRCFYVRFSNVWKPWNDFYAGRPYVDDKGISHDFSSVPFFTNNLLISIFVGDRPIAPYQGKFAYSVGSDFEGEHFTSTCDFEVCTRSTDVNHIVQYNFTSEGRRLYTLLLNLGYKINFAGTFTANTVKHDITKFSLLPLLCYLRAYYDYYLPSKYTNTSSLRKYFEIVDWEISFQNNNNIISFFNDVATTLFANFDSDYFTSSWLTPYSPSGDPQTNFVISNPEGQGYDLHVDHLSSDVAVRQNSPFAYVYHEPSENRESALTQPQLDLLKAAYDFVIRNNLAGNRYFEQMFAKFGIKLPNVMTRRCEFIGQVTSEIQTMDVTSLAGTETDNLGSYAGKGYSVGDGKFDIDANDFGFVIIINNIIPSGGYVQGRNREVMHIDRLQFFNPEFDSKGMQAIRNDEMFAMECTERQASTNANGSAWNPDGVFGFAPRYSEYNRPIDLLSGTFVLNSQNAEYQAYHSFRYFDTTDEPPAQNNLAFRQINPAYNGNNFNRIFYVNNDSVDHFICVFNIDAVAYRKKKSYIEQFDNLDGSDVVTTDPDCQLH